MNFWRFLMVILTVSITISILGCDSHVQEFRQDHPINIEAIKSRVHLSASEVEWLNKHREVKVRIGQWPPFMISASGVSGIAVDYLDLVSRIHGLKFVYLTEKDMSWTASLENIKKKELVDMVPAIQPTAERKKFMVFSNVYQIVPWVIVTQSDAGFIGGLEDLAGSRVSIQEKFILHKTLEKKYPELKLQVIKTATPTLDSLKTVATGKVRATINALPVVTYFIRKYGLSNLKIAAPTRLKDLELAMGIRKDWPELAGIMSKTFSAMSRRDIASINNSWLSMPYEPGIAPRTVFLWTMVAAVAAGFVLITFYIANTALKKKVAERTKALNKELRDRLRAEKARHDSETKFRYLVENCPVPMALEDRHGNLKYFNPCFINTFGYTLNDFPTLEVGFLHSYPDPEYRAEVVEKWTDAVVKAQHSGEIIRSDDILFTCRDGHALNLDIIGIHVGEDIMTVFIDQTGRKNAEQLMMQTEKMMSVGGLAAGMAHEINNPLGIILASAQNMKRRFSPEKKKTSLKPKNMIWISIR